MPIMTFIPELRSFLLSNKVIYTVRSFEASDDILLVIDVGKCHRTFITTINRKEDLVDYVSNSGFPTLEDWWRKIKSFIPKSSTPKYLYKVDLG